MDRIILEEWADEPPVSASEYVTKGVFLALAFWSVLKNHDYMALILWTAWIGERVLRRRYLAVICREVNRIRQRIDVAAIPNSEADR